MGVPGGGGVVREVEVSEEEKSEEGSELVETELESLPKAEGIGIDSSSERDEDTLVPSGSRRVEREEGVSRGRLGSLFRAWSSFSRPSFHLS
jgi:hypothetical protein